jgi:hypothetical protein
MVLVEFQFLFGFAHCVLGYLRFTEFLKISVGRFSKIGYWMDLKRLMSNLDLRGRYS